MENYLGWLQQPGRRCGQVLRWCNPGLGAKPINQSAGRVCPDKLRHSKGYFLLKPNHWLRFYARFCTWRSRSRTGFRWNENQLSQNSGEALNRLSPVEEAGAGPQLPGTLFSSGHKWQPLEQLCTGGVLGSGGPPGSNFTCPRLAPSVSHLCRVLSVEAGFGLTQETRQRVCWLCEAACPVLQNRVFALPLPSPGERFTAEGAAVAGTGPAETRRSSCERRSSRDAEAKRRGAARRPRTSRGAAAP